MYLMSVVLRLHNAMNQAPRVWYIPACTCRAAKSLALYIVSAEESCLSWDGTCLWLSISSNLETLGARVNSSVKYCYDNAPAICAKACHLISLLPPVLSCTAHCHTNPI